jgi:hypothetical protein
VRGVLVAVAVVALLAACSSDDEPSATERSTSTSTTTTSTTTTTTRPVTWVAEHSRETAVAGRYRQGIARDGDTYLFTTDNAIFRTGAGFVETQSVLPALPDDLAAQGYNHIGDGDVADGVLWVPVEKEDKTSGQQLTAQFDAKTLAYIGSVTVAQHHNSFVTVDDDGVVWSTDQFDDDTLLRYRVEGTTVQPLEPLVMSRKLVHIQGADVADGAIWISTDDDHNGIYRVDMKTGEVTDLGSIGHSPDGEGEGIDATDLPSGLLHVLVADEHTVPMYVEDFRVHAQGG